MMARPGSQRGIAVITVLLALAIAVLISSEVIMRVYTGMKRSQNHFNAQQAWQYALGGEAWARQQLAADLEKDKRTGQKVDHLLEEWALPAQKMDIEGGYIEIEIYDIQSQFNLNNLVDDNGAVVVEQVNLMKRLLSYLGVRTVYADLAARWASYADDTDNQYGTEEYPYHAGDTQFGSVSELRQLRDMEMKEYQRMQPFLSVLPVPTTININTAPEPVLAGLTGGTQQMTERLKSFIQRRQQQPNGFAQADAFISIMGIQNDELEEALTVSSEYFRVRVITEYNGRRAWLESVLFRDKDTGEISLLSRDSSLRFTLGNSRDAGASEDTGVGSDNNEDSQREKGDNAGNDNDGGDREDGEQPAEDN